MNAEIKRKGVFLRVLESEGHFGFDSYPQDVFSYFLCDDNSVKDYTQQEIDDVILGSKQQKGTLLAFVEVLPISNIASFLQSGIEYRLKKEEQQRIRSEKTQRVYQTRMKNKAKKEQEQLEKLAKKLGKKVL